MVMLAPVTVNRIFTADNTDILDATPLDAAPDDGEYQVYAASTVNDTLMTARMGQVQLFDNRALPLRSNGMVLMSDDTPVAVIPVASGDKVLIAVDIVTAATVQVVVIFVPG